MALIETRALTKVFRSPLKDPGLAGSLKHLFTRRFSDRLAVDDVNLTIEAGEAVAYVGPNGAGKSTTIKMLTGILVPTSGEVWVDGIVPHRQRIPNARNIGVVFGQRTQLWWDIPVRESLALLKEIHRIPQDRYEATLRSYEELLELDELLPVIGRRLSLGQRMRADLAAALLHEPKILYLDEPTIGLDISVKDRVRAFVNRLVAERGTTVMLTTHDLGDIEDICRRIVIIDRGHVIYDGELQAVKDAFARERSIHFQLEHEAADPLAIVNRVEGVELLPSEKPELLILRFDRFAVSAAEVVAAVMTGADIVDFHIDEPAIEDVIRKVYAGQLDLHGAGA
ncbi:MAG: ABC transporter ATP-binding protein [Gaiellaceae bacterium]